MLRWLRGARQAPAADPSPAPATPDTELAPAPAPPRPPAVQPDSAALTAAKPHLAHADVARARGDKPAAIAALRAALRAAPGLAQAHNNLGGLLRETGREDEALSAFREAVHCQPTLAEAWFNLGTMLGDRGELAAAIDALQRSLALRPKQADAQYWLGNALMGLGDAPAAVDAYQAAIRIDGKMLQARWALAMARIDPVPPTAEAATQCRAAFSRDLDSLVAWCKTNKPAEGFRSVGSTQPYYLTYQAEDNAPLLRRYGGLCTELMRPWEKKVGLPAVRPARGPRRRVGIVSAHFANHSVFNALVRGWLQHADPKRIEIHGFHLGSANDDQTAYARARTHRFETGAREWSLWAKAIADSRLDVVLYPEVGMDSVTAKLAAAHLAPVQVASWGHPETTGLPSIDHFVSASALEPEAAASHYSEHLVVLPGLGCCARRFGTLPAAVDLRTFGIAPGTLALVCPGVPFKYSPIHDALWVEIARRTAPSRLIFFRGPPAALADRLQSRLRFAFSAAGLRFDDHVVFIPWQSQPGFFGLLRAADLVLDSPGFSGFNTAMQAVECAVPMVAFEGGFLRGRFASGVLRSMGHDAEVAATPEAYVETVVELAHDAGRRRRLRSEIAERGRALFEQAEPALAMQRFLLDVD